MNKKILVFGFLAVLMLVSLSFASAITTTPTEKRESPLFKIRTRLAIGERIQNLKAKFVRERIFYLPFQWLIERYYLSVRQPGYLASTNGWVTMCDKNNNNGCSAPPSH